MRKVFAIFAVVLLSVAMTACNKHHSSEGYGYADINTSLVGSKWQYSTSFGGGGNDVSQWTDVVEFVTAQTGIRTIIISYTSTDTIVQTFAYTYQNGTGTVQYDATDNNEAITYNPSKTTLTIGQYEYELVSAQPQVTPTPQPTPQPSGNGNVVGKTYAQKAGEGGFVIVEFVNSTQCVITMNGEQQNGQYQLAGNTGSITVGNTRMGLRVETFPGQEPCIVLTDDDGSETWFGRYTTDLVKPSTLPQGVYFCKLVYEGYDERLIEFSVQPNGRGTFHYRNVEDNQDLTFAATFNYDSGSGTGEITITNGNGEQISFGNFSILQYCWLWTSTGDPMVLIKRQ